jgi:ribosomal protein S18 acetylase RimI-like enzyme
MTSLKIRPATTKDLSKIREFNRKLFQLEFDNYDRLLNLEWTLGKEGEKYFTQRITQKEGCVLMAEKEGLVIGYLCGALSNIENYRLPKKTAELENTYIEESSRSQGIGSKLYREFVKWCKNYSVEIIKVSASARNTQGINFYKKNNFKDYSLMLEARI